MQVDLTNIAPDQDAPVSIDEAKAEPSTTVSIDEAKGSATVATPTTEVTNSRAMKMDLGLGQSSPGFPELYSSIQRGDEPKVRQSQSYLEYLNQQKQRNEIVNNIVRNNILTPDQLKDLTTIVQSRGVNITPEIATEYQYSRALFQNIQQAEMVKNITGAWEKGAPDNLAMNFSLGQGVLARREVLQSNLENSQARLNKQGWGEWGADLGKRLALSSIGLSFLPYVNNLSPKENANIKGTPGELIGGVVSYLHTLPVPQMVEKIKEINTHLNASEQAGMAKYLVDWTQKQTYATNFWFAMDMASWGPSIFVPKMGPGIPKGYTPQNLIPMISDAEKLIFKFKANPTTADFSRPFADPFQIIASLDAKMAEGKVVIPNFQRGPAGVASPQTELTPYQLIKAQQGTRDLAEGRNPLVSSSRVQIPEDQLPVPGTIRSMETPRPATAVELQRALEGTEKIVPESSVGIFNSWRQIGRTYQAVIDAAAENVPPKIEKILTATGEIPEAARVTVAQKPALDQQSFVDRLHSILRSDKFSENSTSFSREAVTRLGNNWTSQAARLLGAITDRVQFDRLPPEAMNAMLTATQQTMIDRLPPSMSNRVVNITRNPVDIGGIPSVTVTLGKSAGTGFDSWQAAQRAAIMDFKLGTNNFKLAELPAGVSQGVSRTGTTPPGPDTIRLYRGEGGSYMGSLKGGNWFTTDLEKAKYYGDVHYIDINKTDKATLNHFAQGAGGPDEYFAPNGIPSNLKRIPYVESQPEVGVAQYGAGHYVTITKAGDETLRDVRDLFTTDMKFMIDKHWTNFLKRFSAAPYTLPESNMEARNVALHGIQRMQAENKKVADVLGKLNRDEHKNMQILFERDRAYEQDGEIGRYAHDLGQFEANYLSEFGRNPTEAEANAYFSFRNLADFDYITKNLGLYKDLSRQGIENWRITVRDKAYSPYFWGRQVDELPLVNKKDNGLWIRDPNYDSQYFRTSKLPPDVREYIEKGLENKSLTAIQVANPIERPLRDHIKSNNGDYINFVIVQSGRAKSQPLDMLMVPYHDGFHREYKAGWYVKQPIISNSGGRNNYEGDVTLSGHISQTEALDMEKAVNGARKAYQKYAAAGSKANKDPAFQGEADTAAAELKDYLAANLPEEHFSFKEWIRRFEGDGNHLNSEEPFRVVEAGKNTFQTYKSEIEVNYPHSFNNEHDSPYNLMRDVDKQFLGSRDPSLWTIKELGSEQQPLFKLENAPMLDIMQSLNRTVSSSAHAMYMQDYKILSAEQFISNFHSVMNKSLSELRENPQYFLLNPPWNKNAANAPLTSVAKAARANILQFIGLDSPDIKSIKWLQSQVVDMVYKTTGSSKATEWVSDHMIGGIKDPLSYIRRVATHLNLGMFNPFQVVNQAQSVVNSWALAGVTGLQGTAGATAMIRLAATKDPAIIAHMDGLLAKSRTGWKEGQLVESMTQLDRSGFDLIQGDTAWGDIVRGSSLVRTQAQKFADAGLVFFKMGERYSRWTAWNTAYLEERAVNPNGVWDDTVMARVLNRANRLNNYMTKAAAAPWEGGIASITTQFWQYQNRLAGQMNPFSSRMTPYEKLRAYAVYGAVYGVPIAASTSVPLWPAYDSIQRYAVEHNISWSNNNAAFGLMEGLPSLLTKVATGGHEYGQSLGPSGIKSFQDFYYSDKHSDDFIKLLGGVSGSKMNDITKLLSPSIASIYDGITTGNPTFWNSPDHPVTQDDILDTIQVVNTLNKATRAYNALMFKAYYTRAGRAIIAPHGDDPGLDKVDQAIITGFGLIPKQVVDTNLKVEIMKQEKQAKEDSQKDITKEMRRALEAMRNKDQDASTAHINKARGYFIAAGWSPLEWNKVVRQSYKELWPLAQSVDADFNVWKASNERLQQRFQNKEQ